MVRFAGSAVPFALLLNLGASASFAQAAVSIAWDTCSGPINKSVLPGTGASMYLSVLGQSQPHKAYEVDVILKQSHALADAWRFDAAGCQGPSRLSIDHATVTFSKVCPNFQGFAQSVQIRDFSYEPATGSARVLLVNSYPSGVTLVNPQARYLLAHFQFDQTHGADGPSDPGNTCGALEEPMCAFISKAIWVSLDGAEHIWAIGQSFVTANDPSNSTHCPFTETTPARAKTWGSIRSQYRN